MRPGKAGPGEPLDLSMRPGETLQLQFMDDETRGQFYVKVIGYVTERSLLVTTPSSAGRTMPVREGRAVIVRAFSDHHASGFTSTVLKSCTQPYEYLHLSYPRKIEPVKIRKSSRVRTALAVSVHARGAAPDAAGVPAVIRDISVSGAQLLSASVAGQGGDQVLIRTRLPLSTIGDQPVELPALIRNSLEEGGVKTSLWRFRCGVEFQPLDAQTTLVLRAYLYDRSEG
jgi:c-di-GMP-binding flagellar brake protein YcgR